MKSHISSLEENGLIDASSLSEDQRLLIEAALSDAEVGAMREAGRRIVPHATARTRSAKVGV